MIQAQGVAEQAGIGRYLPSESITGGPDRDTTESWHGFLNQLTSRVNQADSQANIARHRKWLTVMRFFIGEQLGFVNDAGSWESISRQPGDPIYVVNLLQYFVNALLKDYVRSNATLDVLARGTRLDKRLAARPASELLRLIQQEQDTPTAIERDGKFQILLGNTFRYTICNVQTGKYRKEPVTERVNLVLGGASAVCLECGQISELPSSPDDPEMLQKSLVCQQCGSPSIETVEGASTEYNKIVDFKTVQTPDVMTSIVDPFEMKLPIAAENEILAGWLLRERFVDLSKLQAAHSWASLNEGDTINTGETPLLAKAQIQQSPGNVGGWVTGQTATPSDQRLRKYSQYWFRPEEYYHWVWPNDEQMANGEVIRKGTRAIDLFPKGLYVSQSGSTRLQIEPEDKADTWVMGRWEIVPNALWGYGIDHLIQCQEMQNDVLSLVYEHIMNNTTPPVVLDPQYLSKSQWSNKPGMVAMLKKAAPSGGVGAAFAMAQGRPVGGDTIGFLEMMKGDMQLAAGGAFSTASGLPDVHTDTLGGMQIQRDQALAQHVAKLNRKAEGDVRVGRQRLRIIKKHNLAPIYYPRLSDFSELELKLFEEVDVDVDFEIRYREGSQFPQSMLEKRSNLEAALMLGGLPLGVFNPQFPKAARRLALESLNLPSISEQIGADERNTLLNIYHLMEYAEDSTNLSQYDEFGQPLPPEQVQMPAPELALMEAASIVPVRYRVDDHLICIDVIKDFLKSDDGRHLSPLAELLINDLITRHKQGMMMLMMEDAVNPLMANPMGPTAVPGTPNPAMALPMPMPGAPQQMMTPQQPGGPPKPGQSQGGPSKQTPNGP